MENEQVFVLTERYVDVDSGTIDTNITVYESYAPAQRRFMDLMKEGRKLFKNYDKEEENYIDGDMSWEIWEVGQYFAHHFSIQILCKEIIK